MGVGACWKVQRSRCLGAQENQQTGNREGQLGLHGWKDNLERETGARVREAKRRLCPTVFHVYKPRWDAEVWSCPFGGLLRMPLVGWGTGLTLCAQRPHLSPDTVTGLLSVLLTPRL